MKLLNFFISITCIHAWFVDSLSLKQNQWGQNNIDLKINTLVKIIQDSQSKKTTEYDPKFMFPPVRFRTLN